MSGPILLPEKPAFKTDAPSMLDWGGALTPPNGGATQTLQRLGTRHSLGITLPTMRTEPFGRIWSAKLRLAKLYGAMVYFPQDGLDIRAPGHPVVDGGGQSGTTLRMRGFRPNYAVRFGQAFSVVHAGRRFLYFAAEQLRADGQGRIALPIFPMLRAFPDDGAACEFARPILQGSIKGNELAWARLSAPFSDFGSITITEDE